MGGERELLNVASRAYEFQQALIKEYDIAREQVLGNVDYE